MRHVLVLCLACMASAAVAQTPYDLFPVPSGPVNGLAVIEDTLYFGGDFDALGPRVGAATALDTETGAVVQGVVPFLDTGFDPLSQINLSVPDGAGGVYLGGSIRQADRISLRGLVHVLADGTLDPAFTPDPAANQAWRESLRDVVLADGVLILTGRFEDAAREVVALDAASGALLPFSPTVSDSSGYASVQSVALRDGVAVVAGPFDTINGVARNGLAALDFATGDVLPWEAGIDSTGYVERLVMADETIYAVGRFTSFGGAPRRGLAEFAYPTPTDADAALTEWAPTYGFASGTFYFTDLEDVALSPDALWFAGHFSESLSAPNRMSAPLVRVSRSPDAASAEAALGRRAGGGPYLFDTQAVATDGDTVWISSARGDAQSTTASAKTGVVVGVDARTLAPTGFEVSTGRLAIQSASYAWLQPHVVTMEAVAGRLVVAGRTLNIGGETAPFFGAVSLTTGELLPSRAEPFTNAISDVIPSPDGRRLYLKLAFRSQELLGGYAELDLATGALTRFAVPFSGGGAVRDSTEAPPFGPARYTARRNTGMLATPDRLYVQSGSLGPSAKRSLRALDARTLRPLPEFSLVTDGDFLDLVLADGWLYVSGTFERVDGGVSHLFYLRVDPETGAVDPSWEPIETLYGGTAGGPMAFAEDRFVIGGRGLYRINRTNPVNGFAAFDRPSGAWRPWGQGIPFPTIEALQHADGVFYTSGNLDQIGGVNQYLTAFDENGARLPWPDSQPSRGVRDLLVSERHNRVFVSGEGDVGNNRAYLGSFPALRRGATSTSESTDAVPTTATITVSPNPLRGAARLAIALPTALPTVRIALFDVLGRQVALVHDGPLPSGRTEIAWSATGLSPGVYTARATGLDFATNSRFTVVR